jgi:hypothetical protein
MPCTYDKMVTLYLSPAEADALTTSMADQMFKVVFTCGKSGEPHRRFSDHRGGSNGERSVR